jgi:hypothetical protein
MQLPDLTDEWVNSTEIWKALDGDNSKKPSEFLRYEKNQKFKSYTLRGRNGGTLIEKAGAVAYIEWLTGRAFYDEVADKIQELHGFIHAMDKFEVPDEVKEVYEERNETLYVYAIREEGTGNIKLGISTNPERRLAQLQTGNSSQLSLIGMRIAVDGYRTERRIQEANKQHHIHNEWYTEQATLEVENE